MAVGKQPLNDVLVSSQDAGLRPDELFRIRIENTDFIRRRIFKSQRKDQGFSSLRSDVSADGR